MMRNPTIAIGGIVRKAILPRIGQVAKSTCTAIKATCGAELERESDTVFSA